MDYIPLPYDKMVGSTVEINDLGMIGNVFFSELNTYNAKNIIMIQ